MCVYMLWSDLRRFEEQGELMQPVVFSLLVLLSVMLYFTVSLMDPGFILTETVQVYFDFLTDIVQVYFNLTYFTSTILYYCTWSSLMVPYLIDTVEVGTMLNILYYC